MDVRLERIVVYADKTIELRWKFDNRKNVSAFGRNPAGSWYNEEEEKSLRKSCQLLDTRGGEPSDCRQPVCFEQVVAHIGR